MANKTLDQLTQKSGKFADTDKFHVRGANDQYMEFPDLYKQTGLHAYGSLGALITQFQTENIFRDGDRVQLLGFYAAGDGGGGVLEYASGESRSNHNGGTIIDPTHSISPGGSGWLDSENTGTGCFKRDDKGYWRPEWYGIDKTGADNNYTSFMNLINMAQGKPIYVTGDVKCQRDGASTIEINTDVHIYNIFGGRIFCDSLSIGNDFINFEDAVATYSCKIQGVEFEGFDKIVGGTATSTGITYENIEILHNKVHDGIGGFVFDGKYQRAQIIGNNLYSLVWSGGGATRTYSYGITLGYDGMTLSDGRKCIIENNIIDTIYSNDGHSTPAIRGILAYGEELLVNNNIVSEVAWTGANDDSKTPSCTGIYVRGAYGSCDNNVLRNAGQGVQGAIVSKSFSECSISHNTVVFDSDWAYFDNTSQASAGISCWGENSKIIGNTIEGASRSIDIANSTEVKIAYNSIKRERGKSAILCNTGTGGTYDISHNDFYDVIGDIDLLSTVDDMRIIYIRNDGNVKKLKIKDNSYHQSVATSVTTSISFIVGWVQGAGSTYKNVDISSNSVDVNTADYAGISFTGAQLIGSTGLVMDGVTIKDNKFGDFARIDGHNPIVLYPLLEYRNFRLENNEGMEAVAFEDWDNGDVLISFNYGQTITNQQGSGTVRIDLPRRDLGNNPNLVGAKFRFLQVDGANNFEISPRDGDEIRTGNGANKYIILQEEGAFVELECFEDGIWDIVNINGAHSFEP